MKYIRISSTFLAGLILALLLVACGDTKPSGEVAFAENSTAIVPGMTNESLNNRLPDSNSTPRPTATSWPTSTPRATSTPVPTATAIKTIVPEAALSNTPSAPQTITTAASEAGSAEQTRQAQEDNFTGQAVVTPRLEELARLNGVPKIPLLNNTPRSPQPVPVAKENFGPNNTPLVALQIGHYQIDQLPDEFANIRGETGGSGGGVREVDYNFDIARRTALLLQAKGVSVHILPATVPPAFSADAFIAIHADAVTNSTANGYKLARSRFSAIPQTDDRLLELLYESYGKATGLAINPSITRGMTGYYAFNNRRRLHAITKITPAVILETGFLTSPVDRAVMLGNPDAVANGIADGVYRFLQSRPPLAQREKAQDRVPAIAANLENTPVYSENGALIAYVSKGQLFESFNDRGDSYGISVPVMRQSGFIRKADVTMTSVSR